MRHDEATKVMKTISASWPHQQLEAATVAIWMGVLSGFERTDAMTAVGRLMRTERFLPSIAAFTEAVEAEAHARRNRQAADRGLPAGPANACPYCQGTMLVSDQQGRDRTCRCYRPGPGAPPPDVEPSPERLAVIFAQLRDRLAQRSAQNHWHAGPGPCPVCGGLPADWQQTRSNRHRPALQEQQP